MGYDAENRLVSVTGKNLNAQFTYNGDGQKVKSIVNGETIQFVNVYYEKKGSEITKYYFAGASRVAMRKYTVPVSMEVEYFLGDHLGSTSVTTDNTGAKVSEMRYKPWGEVRFHWVDSNLTTTPAYKLPVYTFTGQRSYMDDPSTSGVEGFGLMDYNARFYDPALGRFISADSIVPGGVQGLDRFAYANNSPVMYVDPSGHDSVCGGPNQDPECDTEYVDPWKHPAWTPPTQIKKHPLTNDLYKKYLELFKTPGWWNNYQFGNFTIWDFINLILSMEFGGPAKGIPSALLQQVVVRNFYKECTTYCDATSAFDVLYYLAARGMGLVHNMSVASMQENEDNQGYYNKTDFADGFQKHDQSWESGCGDGNQPCEWANKGVNPKKVGSPYSQYKLDSYISSALTTTPYGPGTFTNVNSFYMRAGGGDVFFIATLNQTDCVYKHEGAGCTLTPVE